MKKNRGDVTWYAGHRTMPIPVRETGLDEYFAETLLWMDEEGFILDATVVHPNEFVDALGGSFEKVVAQCPQDQSPNRVVASAKKFAKMLENVLPKSVKVVVAETALMDEAFEAMFDSMGSPSFIPPKADPASVGRFFEAAAELFRARPWTIVPSDQALINVTIEGLGIENNVISVIGQNNESLGFVMFKSVADVGRFGNPGPLPDFVSLSFEPGEELPHEMLAEVEEHGWALAGKNAYPLLGIAFDGEPPSAPVAEEQVVAEVVARGLTELVRAHESELRGKAWDGHPVHHIVEVPTELGVFEVVFDVPVPDPFLEMTTAELLQELDALAEQGFEMFEAHREGLENELLVRFEDSPEAVDLPPVIWSGLVLEYLASYEPGSLFPLCPEALHHVIFFVIPRKVIMEAESAGEFLAELRAFVAFLERDAGISTAAECLEVLDASGEERLRARLADSSQYGLAKSMFGAGVEAGYDMSSPADVRTFVEAMNSSHPLGSPTRETSSKTTSSKKKTKAKKKRKAARKARKKSR